MNAPWLRYPSYWLIVIGTGSFVAGAVGGATGSGWIAAATVAVWVVGTLGLDLIRAGLLPSSTPDRSKPHGGRY